MDKKNQISNPKVISLSIRRFDEDPLTSPSFVSNKWKDEEKELA